MDVVIRSLDCKSFFAISRHSNRLLTFYPPAKGHRELKFSNSGVILHGEFEFDVQINVDHRKPDQNREQQKTDQHFSPNSFFQYQKTKCWESSETRFDQVSGQLEPSSGGKRLFKVCEQIEQIFAFSASKTETSGIV